MELIDYGSAQIQWTSRLDSKLGVEVYTKVIGLKELHISYFWASAEFYPETAVFDGQARIRPFHKFARRVKYKQYRGK